MPLKRGQDGEGPYYKWGRRGKKYHYSPSNKRSRQTAKGKAKADRKRIEYFRRNK